MRIAPNCLWDKIVANRKQKPRLADKQKAEAEARRGNERVRTRDPTGSTLIEPVHYKEIDQRPSGDATSSAGSCAT